MSARTAEYLEAIAHLPSGASLVIPNVEWERYEELLDDLTNRPGLRVSYDTGRLEITSPQQKHERFKGFISDLARAFAEETGISLEKFGSTTWKRKRLQKGIEPDECFYVANTHRIAGKVIDLETDPPPDIAVEIDVTITSSKKLHIYAELGVPEVWRYNGEQVEMYQLKDGAYLKTDASGFLLGLSAATLTEFLNIEKTDGQTQALKLFRQRTRSK